MAATAEPPRNRPLRKAATQVPRGDSCSVIRRDGRRSTRTTSTPKTSNTRDTMSRSCLVVVLAPGVVWTRRISLGFVLQFWAFEPNHKLIPPLLEACSQWCTV
uniref:Uncharacterized protein n=1 Tax=Triticum urartu TaxID=4572 RepID=A0A8R7R7F3_TRIUA